MYPKINMPSSTLRNQFFVVVLVVVILSSTCSGQLLTAEYVVAKLPSQNECPKPFYDGVDKIYLLGGCGQERDQIWVYSLSSDTIERVGTLTAASALGSVQGDDLGNIFYLGGGDFYDGEVFKFDLVTNTTTVVAELQNNVDLHTSFKLNDTSNTVYMVGGYGQRDSVLAFDLLLFNYTVTSIEYNVSGGTSVRVGGDKAYVFTRAGEGAALELDLNTLKMQTVGPSSLPALVHLPSSVSDGNFAYIIGGYHSNDAPTDGLFQFNTKSFENTFLPVGNFPVGGVSYLPSAPASVFVPSLNRIYCFGGRSYNPTNDRDVTLDGIFYIDLNPLGPTTTTENPQSTTGQPPSSTTLNPDFFTCNNRTNGFYPHPTDCSMYIECQDKEMTLYTCPPPFLYDPILTVCNDPDQVACGITCVDQPDGNYPHPHDYSLYIVCSSGVPNIFKCPPPLLFDPVQLICFSPDLVMCSIGA